MSRSARQRESRRVLYLALAISAAVHAAALAWIAMPIRVPEASPLAFTMLPPLAEPVPVVPIASPPAAAVTAPALAASVSPAGGSGSGGGAPARPAPERGTPVLREAPAGEAVVAESPLLAASDSLPVVETLPLAVEPMPVVAVVQPVSAGPSAGEQPTVHEPGSVGSAKGRWAGTSPGASGAGTDTGRGGIGIRIGGGPKRHPGTGIGGRGPKRHPPVGVPGRRGGGVAW